MDTTSLWLDEIIKFGRKSQLSTIPKHIFDELKSLGMVEGTHVACKPSGAAYKTLIERNSGTNKKNGVHPSRNAKRRGSSTPQNKRKSSRV